jgi:hypothetical protein
VIRSEKDEDGIIDIGWCEGVLSDGRAFRAEMWAQDQISMLTIFFSAMGMEELSQDAMRAFVEEEGLITFAAHPPQRCASSIVDDDVGSEMWSVNVVVGDEDQTFLSSSVPIFRYSIV